MILSTAIDSPSLIKQFLDCSITGEHNQGLCAEYQTVDWSILLRPFFELLVGVSRWDLALLEYRIDRFSSRYLMYIS